MSRENAAHLTKGQMKHYSSKECVHCEEIAEKLQKHTETIERQNDAIMQILAEHKILLDRLLSQNVAVTTILNIFPINSEEKLSELNEMLSAQSIIYIKHLKTLLKGNVEKNLSEILATEIIMNFNVEGTFGKKRLRKYENVYAALIGLTMCYQRLSVNNNNHNNLDQKPTHLPPLHYPHGHRWNEPYFDLTMPKNITSLVGKSAYLGCRVKHLGNKTVAWIRHRDLHILTVGTYTYTTDQRFQTSYHRDIDEWTLQIKWAQQRDAGVYECQISTQPVRSFSVNLNIVDTIDTEKNSLLQQYYNDDAFYIGADRVYQTNDDEFAGMFGPIQTIAVPTATILGGPDLYVDKGSTINLTCAIKFSPEPPTHIFWYHQDKVLSEETSGGRITFKTIKSEETKSILLINDADLLDSGKYSCYPSNTEIASIRVHVLQGERPEAMQTNAATTATMHAAMLQPSKFIGAIISLVGLSQIYAIFSQIQQNYRINRNAELLSRANKQRDERITRNIKATLFDGEYGQRDYSESATASSQNYSNYNNNNNNLHKNKRTVTR